jgi:hybrid cluster-associated redox disulfide protein
MLMDKRWKMIRGKKSAGDQGNKITIDMTLGDIISKYPETAEVMMKYGLHCVGCHVAAFETLGQGAKTHGMSDKDIESMISEMNKLIKNIKKESEG